MTHINPTGRFVLLVPSLLRLAIPHLSLSLSLIFTLHHILLPTNSLATRIIKARLGIACSSQSASIGHLNFVSVAGFHDEAAITDSESAAAAGLQL